MLAIDGKKNCPSCKLTKPVVSFSKNRATKDGLQTYCKECLAEKKNMKDGDRSHMVRTVYGRTQDYYRGPNHGQSKTPLYRTWANMRRRCKDPNVDAYKWYGGRGISVCQEWEENFLVFKEWADSTGYEHGFELDRENSDGNYEPSNCRWATKTENLKNRRAYLPEELEVRLKQEAERQHKGVYAIIREAIELYLDAGT
jgi:hypothetical protein